MRPSLAPMGLALCALLLSACAAPWARRPTASPPQPPASAPTEQTPALPPVQPPTTPGQAAANQAWIDPSGSPFALRGIIEGFYGTPWTQAQRLGTFDFMARVGMNTYVYAPKDDPYQRSQWRKPYPDAELDRFRALLGRAKADGVTFVYSISPGLDITYSSDADRKALAAKVEQLRALGIHTLMLSLDDVLEQLSRADRTVYGQNYALAQADLANWLYGSQRQSDPQFALWLTPSHYWGTKADDYLTTLGARLDPGIGLVWTGPDVLSTQITAADADAFAAVVKRKPIVWDNYPVNDYTYVQKHKPRLIMGPLRGRSADLAPHVAGYIANPMIQPEASQLPLYTAAAYLAQPGSYDPQAAWREAAGRLTSTDAGAAALLEFASHAQISAVTDQEAPDLAAAIDAYQRGAAGSTARLQQRFSAMVTMPERLAGAVSPSFYQEVTPWVQALQHKGQAGLLALEVDAAAARKDSAAVKARLPQLKAALAAMQADNSKAYIATLLVEDFTAQVIDRAQALSR